MGRPVIRTALDLPIIDLGGFYASPNAEGALAEIGGGGGGGGAAFAENEFVAISNGQTIFTLSVAFLGVGGLAILHVNGVVYAKDTDFTISGTTLTWLNNLFALEIGDCVTCFFQTS